MLLSQTAVLDPGKARLCTDGFHKGNYAFKLPLQPNNQKLRKDRKDTCIL